MINPKHNEEIRLSIGAFRTSPVNRIPCIAEEPPLQARKNKGILKYIFKKKTIQHHIISKIRTSDPRPNKPSQHIKIIYVFKKLINNLTFDIEPLAPNYIVS